MTKKSALSTEEAIELINLLKRKVINQTIISQTEKVDLNLKLFLMMISLLLLMFKEKALMLIIVLI